jgi:biopolymer transport protein ExbD
VNFLPNRKRRSPLALASPLACGAAAVAVAFVAIWGTSRAGWAVPVELPKVSAGAERRAPNFGGHVITVRRDGGYSLGGTRLPRTALAARLARLGQLRGGRQERIIVRADARASFARVIDLLEMCRRSGLGSVSFEVLEESQP